MSEEQLKAFLEAVKMDAGLQGKLKSAVDSNAVVEIAKVAGFKISADDLETTELNLLGDYELELAAGGVGCQLYGSNTNTQAAYCTSNECPSKCDMPVC